MQFVANGPDIPDELLQAHEEGNVVFFCGAGISYPAGLPGFEGLVEKIYKSVGDKPSDIEQRVKDNKQFDAVLDLLERRLPGQRSALRTALAKSLKPNLRKKGAIETHKALLTLAHDRKGALRLITTNFDTLFENAGKKIGKKSLNTYSAPMLPIPKNSKWNGLVYLHGQLPKKLEEALLNRLVITSGDFGLAYLTERWAARFVSELFRNYIVCFVGYSINDPVLRYMMDALAADRMLGETTPLTWAFAESYPSEIVRTQMEWEAKGVNPIIYEIPTGTHDHSALHNTLQVWSETYRDGISGKQNIVLNNALAKPSKSTQQDNFVGRMLWALSDPSGLPTKTFADINPVPPLDWLFDAFLEDRYKYKDLSLFGVAPVNEEDKELSFSLVNRPTPYQLSPRMSLLKSHLVQSQWDKVMFQLARWLLRHLNDTRLILWVSKHSSGLHDNFLNLLNQHLDDLNRKINSENNDELNEILTHSPMGVPDQYLQKLWRLILNGKLQSPLRGIDLYQWKRQFSLNGISTILRLSLRELLAPKVSLKNKFFLDDAGAIDELMDSGSLIDAEVILSSEYVHAELVEFDNLKWKQALPSLLEDFQLLLKDTLDLLCELGKADSLRDLSYWHLPSIEPHAQNRSFYDWVSLIELLRDSWIALKDIDIKRASIVSQSWFEQPYPAFKRLAFFAASKGSIDVQIWANWLLSENTWWLWSINTRREVYRLFVLQGNKLHGVEQESLELAILNGPPREMFRDDMGIDEWNNLITRSIWLHLAKLESSGLKLSENAKERLSAINKKFPEWRLRNNERDEFSHWMSGTGDADFEDERIIDDVPTKRNEIVNWLLSSEFNTESPHNHDNWREVCRKHPMQVLFALKDLAEKEIWPSDRWKTALQVWSERRLAKRTWSYAASFIQAMPDAPIISIVHSLSYWMQAASEKTDCNREIFLKICNQILEKALENEDDSSSDQPVFSAINHPVGHVTDTLINLWFASNPNDNDSLPVDIKPFFTTLCDTGKSIYKHGRVILASRLIALYRVDKNWTITYLLPLFNWDNNEAKNVWEGFLWSPRLYMPLMIELKPAFLDTVNYYDQLGKHQQQYARFLTYAALNNIDGYTNEEYRTAFLKLPQDGLNTAASALSDSIKGNIDQTEAYWNNRISVFWQEIWPKNISLATVDIAKSVAKILIASGDEFPLALESMKGWLKPINYPFYILESMIQNKICEKFPVDALDFLYLIVNKNDNYQHNLMNCLDEISKSNSDLEKNHKYIELINL